MEHNKKNNKATFWIICIAGILTLLMITWLIFHALSSKKNSINTPSQPLPTTPIVVPTDEPLITPTVIPSSKSGLKTFIFASKITPYSFEYPSTWGLVEINHDNIVRLNYSGHCRVEFSSKASADNNFISGTPKEATYGGRTFQMTTSKSNTLSIETYSLSNITSKDGFSTVAVEISPYNTSQCQQTVDQILSSLTFGE